MGELAELSQLISFFAQPLERQWEQLPDTILPVRVTFGEIDFPTRHPARMLASILRARLERLSPELRDEPDIEILHEIRLVLWFMIENANSFIFAKRNEISDLDYIWRALSRLCKLALTLKPFREAKAQGDLQLEHFISTYSTPTSVDDVNQFEF